MEFKSAKNIDAKHLLAYNMKLQMKLNNNMKLKDLHNKTGFSYSYLSNVSLGKANISIDKIEVIAGVLNTPIHLMFLPISETEKS